MPNRIQKMCANYSWQWPVNALNSFLSSRILFLKWNMFGSWKYSIVLASFFSTFQKIAALQKKWSTSFMLQIVMKGILYWTDSAKNIPFEPGNEQLRPRFFQVPGSSNIWWNHSSANECRSDDRKWPFGVQSPQFFQWHFRHVNGPSPSSAKKKPSAVDEISLFICKIWSSLQTWKYHIFETCPYNMNTVYYPTGCVDSDGSTTLSNSGTKLIFRNFTLTILMPSSFGCVWKPVMSA